MQHLFWFAQVITDYVTFASLYQHWNQSNLNQYMPFCFAVPFIGNYNEPKNKLGFFIKMKEFIEHHFGLDKIDSVIEYLANKNNNIKEARKCFLSIKDHPALYNLLKNITLENLHRQIYRQHLFFFLFSHGNEACDYKCKVEGELRKVIIHKIKNDLFYLTSSLEVASRFLRYIRISEINWMNEGFSAGITVLEYFFVFSFMAAPILNHLLKHSEPFNSYIEDKIKSYTKLLASTDPRDLRKRMDVLEPSYQYLFFKINQSEQKEIPLLKFLSVFYVKHHTDIDINTLSLPQEIKSYVNKL